MKPTEYLSRQHIFFVRPPCLHNLICLNLLIVPDENQSFLSDFQAQIIRTRQLIFSKHDLLAAPGLNLNQVLLIARKSQLESSVLTNFIKSLSLKIKSQFPVTDSHLQACLSYSLNARLAPQWNKVGDMFLQGRNFLEEARKRTPAVKVDVRCVPGEVTLNISAALAQLSVHRIRECIISDDLATKFERDYVATVSKEDIYKAWCHVLPSMKKGQIVSITKHLPSDSSLSDYESVKKYWKNLYGYRLPPESFIKSYYNVVFRLIGPNPMTYPDVCVMSDRLSFSPRFDASAILQAFSTDLYAKMPTICGKSLEMSCNYLCPAQSTQLLDSFSQLSCLFQSAAQSQKAGDAQLRRNDHDKVVPLAGFTKSLSFGSADQVIPVNDISDAPHESHGVDPANRFLEYNNKSKLIESDQNQGDGGFQNIGINCTSGNRKKERFVRATNTDFVVTNAEEESINPLRMNANLPVNSHRLFQNHCNTMINRCQIPSSSTKIEATPSISVESDTHESFIGNVRNGTDCLKLPGSSVQVRASCVLQMEPRGDPSGIDCPGSEEHDPPDAVVPDLLYDFQPQEFSEGSCWSETASGEARLQQKESDIHQSRESTISSSEYSALGCNGRSDDILVRKLCSGSRETDSKTSTADVPGPDNYIVRESKSIPFTVDSPALTEECRNEGLKRCTFASENSFQTIFDTSAHLSSVNGGPRLHKASNVLNGPVLPANGFPTPIISSCVPPTLRKSLGVRRSFAGLNVASPRLVEISNDSTKKLSSSCRVEASLMATGIGPVLATPSELKIVLAANDSLKRGGCPVKRKTTACKENKPSGATNSILEQQSACKIPKLSSTPTETDSFDLLQYVKNGGQLQKLSNGTLVKWLKEHKVGGLSKMKKPDLVDRCSTLLTRLTNI